jgi:hypothetical protein
MARALHQGVREEATMLLLLAIILGLAWIFGFTVYHVASGAIHVLLVLAIAALVVHFVRGTRRVV